MRESKFPGGAVMIIPIFIGVVYAYISYFIPITGDDLNYRENYIANSYSLDAIIQNLKIHWYWANSRLADILNPIPLVYMPLWLNALCCGIATGALFALTARWCGSRSTFFRLVVIALVAFTLRWDALWMEFVTQYNYVWPTAFVLAALAIIVSDRCDSTGMGVAGIFLCPLAGGMHEACGLPILSGLIMYFLFNHRRLSLRRGVLLLLFGSGSVFTMLAPGYFKISDTLVAPDSLPLKVFGGAYYILILIGLILSLVIGDRRRFKFLLHDYCLIFAVAALCSLPFVVLAGYVGRPGWFGQIYALIAICRIIATYDFKVPERVSRVCGAIIIGLLLFHFGALAVWQPRLGREVKDVIAQFQKSPDGVVFYDYTDDADCPAYLLGKTRGVPDTDDVYYLSRMSQWYGEGKNITILPRVLSSLDFNNFHGTLCLDGAILSSIQLPGVRENSIYTNFPRYTMQRGDEEYVERQFDRAGRSFYFYAPLRQDVGEK